MSPDYVESYPLAQLLLPSGNELGLDWGYALPLTDVAETGETEQGWEGGMEGGLVPYPQFTATVHAPGRPEAHGKVVCGYQAHGVRYLTPTATVKEDK